MIYEKLASYYDMFVDEKLVEEYVKLIQFHHQTGSVLDLGTGTGPLAIELAKNGYHVTATDISTEMLEVAYNNAIIEDVKINFFIHDILDTVNRDYDIICMSSDVINYLQNETEVRRALENVSLAMNTNSIFLFDAIKPTYIHKLSGYKEDVLLKDDVMRWSAVETNIEHQIKHTIQIGNHIESHLQMAYTLKDMAHMLKDNHIEIIKKIKYEDRILYLCKKEL